MQIIDKDGRERDVKGVLPDGAALKVPMTFMDSAQRAVAKTFQTSGMVTDAHGDSDLHALSRPGARYPTQRTTADVARTLAYQDSEETAANAWKTPPVTPPPATACFSNAAKVGDARTVDGRAGHLRELNGGLIFEPDAQHDARLDDRERAYREVQLRDESAWRNAT
jgi:hypothetical protein